MVIKFLKKAQAELPIIGLASKILAAEGGIGGGVLTYSEFGRTLYEKAPIDFHIATEDLERLQPATKHKLVVFAMWITAYGVGRIQHEALLQELRLMGSGTELVYFIEKFEQDLERAEKANQFGDEEPAAMEDKLKFAVKGLVEVAELKRKEAIPPDYAGIFARIIQGAFPTADAAFVEATVAAFPDKKYFRMGVR